MRGRPVGANQNIVAYDSRVVSTDEILSNTAGCNRDNERLKNDAERTDAEPHRFVAKELNGSPGAVVVDLAARAALEVHVTAAAGRPAGRHSKKNTHDGARSAHQWHCACDELSAVSMQSPRKLHGEPRISGH